MGGQITTKVSLLGKLACLVNVVACMSDTWGIVFTERASGKDKKKHVALGDLAKGGRPFFAQIMYAHTRFFSLWGLLAALGQLLKCRHVCQSVGWF